MVKIPVYFDQPVRVSQDASIVKSEVVTKSFVVDATGGAVTIECPGMGDTGFVYRLVSIYHDLIVGSNGYMRYSLLYGPAVAGQTNIVWRRLHDILAIQNEFASFWPSAGSSSVTVGTNRWRVDTVPDMWFDHDYTLELNLTGGNYGTFRITFEKVRV